MADEYVYYFTTLDVRTGARVRSTRRATLEAIKLKGEPVMESQIVVDPSELDSSGYLVGRAVDGTHPTDEVWGEIRSLILRAASREREALGLDEKTEGSRKYLLTVEGRELRTQAARLLKHRADERARELGGTGGNSRVAHFGGEPTTR